MNWNKFFDMRDICVICEKFETIYTKYGLEFCFFCTRDYIINGKPLPNQPERSKREDSQKCEMRCSEHCGNTVSHK